MILYFRSLSSERDLSLFIWTESTGDVPAGSAWTQARTRTLADGGGLMMKAKAYTNSTQTYVHYSKSRLIPVDRQMYPSYAKIRLMRSEIKEFRTIVFEFLSEICEAPTYASPTYARFTVFHSGYNVVRLK